MDKQPCSEEPYAVDETTFGRFYFTNLQQPYV